VLRILGQLLELVEHLRRIAACPAVNPVDLVSAALTAITATAAAIVPVVIQGEFFLTRDPAPVCVPAQRSNDLLPHAPPSGSAPKSEPTGRLNCPHKQQNLEPGTTVGEKWTLTGRPVCAGSDRNRVCQALSEIRGGFIV
jgi:hypothetical protein